ncbi:MAG: tyrosine-type recombinase/integrase [Solirubrobacterales bacterium]
MAAKLEKTRYRGIYRRGSRYVITWEYRGKQRKESFRTLDEAREAKANRIAGEKRPKSRVQFGSYFEAWIENYAGRTARGFSETTRAEYRRPIADHALPVWRTWKVTDIEPADVRELFGQMRREERSTSQLKKLRAALSVMFATAIEDRVITSNPAASVRIPASPTDQLQEDEPAKALTRADLSLLLTALPKDWRLFFEFLAHSGLRISEAVGLRWEHIDLGSEPRVMVREQLYKGQRKRLKSADGKRDVPLSPNMVKRLRALRRDTYSDPRAPVFASKAGTPLRPENVYRRVLAPAAIAAGFKVEVLVDGDTRTRSAVSFHNFRHTCASLLFEAGRNVKQVQAWLGHADPSFTLSTYIHLMDAGVGSADFLDQAVSLGGKGVARKDPGTSANQDPADPAQMAA